MTGNTNTNLGTNTNLNAGANRSPLEQKAEAVREKVSSTLDSLEQKGKELFSVDINDVKNEIQQHPVTYAVIGGSVVLALGTGIGLLTYFLNRRRQRTFAYRWDLAKQLLLHPERLFN
jgi:hypothetical protein